MHYPAPYNAQSKQLPTSQTQRKRSHFPVKSLPKLIRKATEILHDYTQIPVELIVSVFFTVLSLVCQYITAVKLPHSGAAKPVSLYLLTTAESGEGKSFILKLLIKPILECLSGMNEEYQSRLKEYKDKHRIWKMGQQALDAALRQAIKHGYDGENETRVLEEYCSKEPQKPVKPKFIYEDVSYKALIQGLSLQAEAGIITDEGISFFKGMLKNHLALLNKGWDGGTYDFQRADGESYELELCLMISLMIQPSVFRKYLHTHGETAKSSGFLARFLITQVESNIGNRTRQVDIEDLEHALVPFHDCLRELLEILKKRFYGKNIPREVIKLSEEAKELLQAKRTELERKIIPGGELAHISDFISKFPDNAVRIAAIFKNVIILPIKTLGSELCGYNIIDKQCMQDALDVMDWYTEQANDLFYPMSERFLFEKDVLDIHSWIANALIQQMDKINVPICLSDILQRGPNRLRKREALEPILAQLIHQKSIFLFCDVRGGPTYILPNNNIMEVMPCRLNYLFPHGVKSKSVSEFIPVQASVLLPAGVMPHYPV